MGTFNASFECDDIAEMKMTLTLTGTMGDFQHLKDKLTEDYKWPAQDIKEEIGNLTEHTSETFCSFASERE